LRETFLVQESNGRSLATILTNRDKGGMTPFLAACKSGHLDVVGFLLEKGTNVYERDYHGRTPLHLASQNGHLNVVSRLVELGASVNEKSNHGWTPLHSASSEGHVGVVNQLVELGASVNEKDIYGGTPLHLACKFGNTSIVMLLLRHNALKTEDSDYRNITSLLHSRDSMLAVLSYGFNPRVSEDDLQELTSDVRDLYRIARDMCPLQVISFSPRRMI
jgi:ankyrin repeat protein